MNNSGVDERMEFHSAGPQIIIRDLKDEDYDKYHDIFYSHAQFKKIFLYYHFGTYDSKRSPAVV